ncbi:class II glutamine amidotransferase [Accumulibacter sp.]|uniref:class II glutamine amidotransferase n=1 Tax=Accumulibacter sp. TaxID=2053492 RepID=UPI0025E63EC5|nr:class II glutamine amidotransferase [Accumulibacter sp.]MCM8596338.1 class II glutamine amidotransferase [Accumulibacter sp.]MCM8627472.1 class II glutamine amidotransferase [Accumulibacter sp.]MDS4050487.1 class II glutamine amidotransferase [Accumulibacter sp.]
MCQLLAMNCNVPTDVCFSFAGFQARGGATDVHADGWGIAFFEDRGARVFLDPQPSCVSPVAELVRNYPIHSKNVVAHIRKATQGGVALENTHPFMRELWGRYWIFAHNGHLPDFVPVLDGQFTPVGETDSERAFCWLLQSLHRLFGRQPPAREALFDALHRLSLDLGARGVCNFLLSNGDCLVAHCSTRLSYIVRQAPFAVAHLCDQDLSIDFREVTNPDDRVAVIATVPLTDNERWEAMPRGSLWLFHDGAPVRQQATVAGPETPPT